MTNGNDDPAANVRTAIAHMYQLANSGNRVATPDRADGPAFIETSADESRREGQLDRADGPAFIVTYADGSRREEWYRQGQLERADGPAVIETSPDGYRCAAWYHHGQRDRADGPAVIETYVDGRRREAWYRQGELVKEELANLSAIGGVTLHPATPAGPYPAAERGMKTMAEIKAAVGDENFEAGLARYFETHADGAIAGDELIAGMEEISGHDLSRFKTGIAKGPKPS